MLEIGDRVKIRTDLKVGWRYSANNGSRGESLVFGNNMVAYMGLVATITKRHSIIPYVAWGYKIDLDGETHAWSENMFEPFEFVSKDEFEKFMRS